MKYKFGLLLMAAANLLAGTVNAQNYIWAKGEGGLGNDAANSIAVDDAGNSYITGNLAGEADFSGTVYKGRGIYDVFIAKYSSSGGVQWVKTAGGKGNDKGVVVKYNAGNLYVAGAFEDTAWFENTMLVSKGESDIFLAKYDGSGALVWVKSAGGEDSDYPMGMDLDDSGNVLVAGGYEKSAGFDGTVISTTNIFQESFIAKYNSNGALQWAKSSVGTGTNLITGICNAHNGALYVTGFFGAKFKLDSVTVTSSSPSYDIMLGRLNGDGSLVWLKRAGSIAEDAANAVCADNNGNAFITGYFTRTALFDNNQVSYYDYNDIFVAKYDAQGNNAWVRAGKGSQLDVGFNIAADNRGNIFVTGMFEFAADFDGHIVTGPDREVFIISFDTDGHVRWIDKATGVQTSCGLGVAVRANENLALCGYYLHTCNFGSIALEYATNNDLFIAEYDPPFVNGIGEAGEGLSATAYPNPVAAGKDCRVTVEGDNTCTLRIADVTGRQILADRFIGAYTIPAANWAQGLYFVELGSGLNRRVFKLVRE